nr:hypothetical protein [Tanacetum cinerariifolium]
MMSVHQFALLDRLSMIEHLLEQLAELYSKHDPVKVVSLAGKTIQDAEMFEQLVDHRHLSQTPDVGDPPTDRTSALRVAFTDSSIREIHHFLIEVNLGADTASANGLVCLYSEKDVSNDLNLSSKRNAELNVRRFSRIMLGIVGSGIGASPDVVIVAMVEGVIIDVCD